MSFLAVAVRSHLFRLVEGVRVAWRYWRRLTFFQADMALMFLHCRTNPYRLLRRRGGTPYGETPLTTFDHIARECRILSHDVVVDLGAGRGRLIFWLATHVGCRAIGVEAVATFVKRAEWIKEWLRLGKVEFIYEDIEQVRLEFAAVSCVYLYGTAFQDEQIHKIADQLKGLKRGTKVITVSYSLSEIGVEGFFLKKQFLAHFPWGKTTVYLQTVE